MEDYCGNSQSRSKIPKREAVTLWVGGAGMCRMGSETVGGVVEFS